MAEDLLRNPVVIWSEGSRLAAEVIRPAGEGGTRPRISLCHGWGRLREYLAERYAIPFAQAGYVCLVFDYLRGRCRLPNAEGRPNPAFRRGAASGRGNVLSPQKAPAADR